MASPLKQGYLIKQGGSHKSLKKRWFILHNGPKGTVLEYYRNDKAKELLGDINLNGVTINQINNQRLEIGTLNRIYVLQTERNEDITEWTNVIRETIYSSIKSFIEPLMEGYIYKQGDRIRTWKRRFGSLTSDKKFTYYKTDSKSEKQGEVLLERIIEIKAVTPAPPSNSKPSPFQFTVTMPQRIFMFAAESQLDMEAWMSAFKDSQSIPSPMHSTVDLQKTGSMSSNLSRSMSLAKTVQNARASGNEDDSEEDNENKELNHSARSIVPTVNIVKDENFSETASADMPPAPLTLNTSGFSVPKPASSSKSSSPSTSFVQPSIPTMALPLPAPGSASSSRSSSSSAHSASSSLSSAAAAAVGPPPTPPPQMSLPALPFSPLEFQQQQQQQQQQQRPIPKSTSSSSLRSADENHSSTSTTAAPSPQLPNHGGKNPAFSPSQTIFGLPPPPARDNFSNQAPSSLSPSSSSSSSSPSPSPSSSGYPSVANSSAPAVPSKSTKPKAPLLRSQSVKHDSERKYNNGSQEGLSAVPSLPPKSFKQQQPLPSSSSSSSSSSSPSSQQQQQPTLQITAREDMNNDNGARNVGPASAPIRSNQNNAATTSLEDLDRAMRELNSMTSSSTSTNSASPAVAVSTSTNSTASPTDERSRAITAGAAPAFRPLKIAPKPVLSPMSPSPISPNAGPSSLTRSATTRANMGSSSTLSPLSPPPAIISPKPLLSPFSLPSSSSSSTTPSSSAPPAPAPSVPVRPPFVTMPKPSVAAVRVALQTSTFATPTPTSTSSIQESSSLSSSTSASSSSSSAANYHVVKDVSNVGSANDSSLTIAEPSPAIQISPPRTEQLQQQNEYASYDDPMEGDLAYEAPIAAVDDYIAEVEQTPEINMNEPAPDTIEDESVTLAVKHDDMDQVQNEEQNSHENGFGDHHNGNANIHEKYDELEANLASSSSSYEHEAHSESVYQQDVSMNNDADTQPVEIVSPSSTSDEPMSFQDPVPRPQLMVVPITSTSSSAAMSPFSPSDMHTNDENSSSNRPYAEYTIELLIQTLTEAQVENDRTKLVRACKEIALRAAEGKNFKHQFRSEGGIPILVDMIRGDEADIIYPALRALINLSDADANRQELYRSDAVSALMTIMVSQSHRLPLQAATVLMNMCCTEAAFIQSDMRNAGVVATFVNMLQPHVDMPLRIVSLQALMNLSSNDLNQAAIAEAGGVPLLRNLLLAAPVNGVLADSKIDSAERASRRLAAFILCNMATNDSLKDIMRRNNCIQPLILLLKSSFEDIQIEAARALTNMSSMAANIPEIRAYGAVPELIRLLASANNDLVLFALWVLSNIAVEEAGQFEIHKHGGIPLIVRRLASVDENEVVQLRAAWALANLSLTTVNRQSIKESGGVPHITRLCASPLKEIVSQSVKALANLAIDEDLRAVLFEADACKVLIALLGTSDQTLLEIVLIALCNMSLNGKARDEFRRLDGLEQMLKLATNGGTVKNPSIQLNAMKLLTNAAFNDYNRRIILDMGGNEAMRELLSNSIPDIASQANKAIQMLSMPVPDSIPPSSAPVRRIQQETSASGPFSTRPAEKSDLKSSSSTAGSAASSEGNTIWAKCTYADKTVAFKIGTDVSVQNLHDRVRERFAMATSTRVQVHYKDEAGDLIAVETDDDWQYALDSHRELSKGDKSVKLSLTVSVIHGTGSSRRDFINLLPKDRLENAGDAASAPASMARPGETPVPPPPPPSMAVRSSGAGPGHFLEELRLGKKLKQVTADMLEENEREKKQNQNLSTVDRLMAEIRHGKQLRKVQSDTPMTRINSVYSSQPQQQLQLQLQASNRGSMMPGEVSLEKSVEAALLRRRNMFGTTVVEAGPDDDDW